MWRERGAPESRRTLGCDGDGWDPDCGGFVDACIFQNIKLYTLDMRDLLRINYSSRHL